MLADLERSKKRPRRVLGFRKNQGQRQGRSAKQDRLLAVRAAANRKRQSARKPST